VRAPDWNLVALSAGASVVLLAAGVVYFRSTEKAMADLV
jgi:hypothetical protein